MKWIGGEGIIPLDKEDALDWAAQNCDAETIANFFEVEDA